MIARVIHEDKIAYGSRRLVYRLVVTSSNAILTEVQGSPDGLGNPRWSPCDVGLERLVLERFIRKVLAEGWTA